MVAERKLSMAEKLDDSAGRMDFAAAAERLDEMARTKVRQMSAEATPPLRPSAAMEPEMLWRRNFGWQRIGPEGRTTLAARAPVAHAPIAGPDLSALRQGGPAAVLAGRMEPRVPPADVVAEPARPQPPPLATGPMKPQPPRRSLLTRMFGRS